MRDIYEIIAKGFENDFYLKGYSRRLGKIACTCRLIDVVCGPDSGEDIFVVSGLQEWEVPLTASQFRDKFIQFVD